jgi:tetratricopeptide (TPR) repeat protein
LSLVYEAQGEKEKAIQTYEDILDVDPDNIRAMMGLAYFYHRNGMAGDAEIFLRDLGVRSISEPEIIRKVVQFYIEPKNYDAAIVILEGMLKGAPDSADIHYAAGIAFDGMGNDEKALTHFRKVMPDSKFYENAAVHISFIYQKQGETRKAILFLKEVIRQVPDNPEFMMYLGSFYEESEAFEDAVNVLLKGAEIDPENPKIHFRLGVAYDKWGKKDACIASMKEAIRLDPQNANALNYLGYTYADLGRDLDEAERLIREALKYKPDDGYIIDSLGWVFYKKGMFQEAVQTLGKAVELVPDDPIILEHLGDAYLKTEDKEAALELYKRSLLKKETDKESLEKKIQELSGEDS